MSELNIVEAGMGQVLRELLQEMVIWPWESLLKKSLNDYSLIKQAKFPTEQAPNKEKFVWQYVVFQLIISSR